MSQAGPVTGSAASLGAVIQLTPDTGAAVVPTAGNINVVGHTNTTVSGITTSNDAVSTLGIQLNNYSNLTATTTNATPNTSMTIALGAVAGVYTFDVTISAFNATDTLAGGYAIYGTMRTDGASATVIGTPDKITHEEGAMSAADVTIVASGNNAVIQVTGIAAKTIRWRSITFYTFVS